MAVVNKIVGSPKKPKEPVFEDLEHGQFFWYDEELYLKSDEDDAVRIHDGYVNSDIEDDDTVVPEKVVITCGVK